MTVRLHHSEDDAIIAETRTANRCSLRLLDRLGFVAERRFDEVDAMQSQLRLARPAPGSFRARPRAT